MEDQRRVIGDSVRVLAGTSNFMQVKMADVTVVSVDEGERTCVVDSADENSSIDGLVVRLLPEIADGELDVPALESTITIMWSPITPPTIIYKSWLDKKWIVIGDQSFKIEKDKTTINDGGYGGIPRVINPDDNEKALLTKINNLEKLVNKLNARLQSFIDAHAAPNWTIVPQDGGAALQVAIGIWETIPTNAKPDDLTETTQTDIENPNVTHGKDLPDQ